MFGFDGDKHGFKSILRKIASNDEYQLTHKEIRAYARCLLKVLPNVNIDFKIEPEVKIMLATLSVSGLPHYDRAFLANQILKLLESVASEEKTIENFDNF